LVFLVITFMVSSGLPVFSSSESPGECATDTLILTQPSVKIHKCFQGTNAHNYGVKEIDIELEGTGFGNTQGNKYLKFGKYVIKSTTGVWDNNHVLRRIGLNHFNYGQKYPVYIVMKNRNGEFERISNQVYLRPLMLIYQVVPKAARPGAVVSLEHNVGITMGWFGTTQGTKKLMFGAQEAVVVFWSEEKITARVPVMSPGVYKIHIKDGGKTVSKQVSFTVKPMLIKKKFPLRKF